MKKELVKQVMVMTRDMLEGLWSQRIDEYIDQFDEKATVLGPYNNEFLHGKESIQSVLQELSEKITANRILNVEIYPIVNDTRSCTVLAHFIIKKVYPNHHIDYLEQSVTAVWVRDKSEQQHIVHLHYSIPSVLEKNISDYSLESISMNSSGRDLLISIKDDQRHLRMISLSNIECATADGHNVIIFMTNETLHAHISWKELLSELKKDNRFLQVHRSHVVRMDAVKLIGKNYLEMNSGKRVPIPVKNMPFVIEKLTGRKSSR